MCGRFTLTENLPMLQQQFGFDLPGEWEWEPRFNVAPSQNVLAIGLTSDGRRRGNFLKWGLVPFWAKDPKIGYKMINARSEEVDQKPAYREAFKSRRCLILCDGFYEWKQTDSGKRPYRFVMKNRKPFAFAGLYEVWKSSEGSRPLYTCTVLTTTPNELTQQVHDRMPVILQPEDYETWMRKEMTDIHRLKSLLTPYPADDMMKYEVSSLVNSPKNDVAELVQPLNSL